VSAARLAAAGVETSVLARGETLAAIQNPGLQLNDLAPIPLAVSEGVQDVVFIAVKAHSLEALLPSLLPLIGPQTILVPTMNGIPWWYFQGLRGYAGEVIRAVDPQGKLLAAFDADALIGAVVYLTAESVSPGRVIAAPPYRIILGEPGHRASERVDRLCAMLQNAGFDAVASAHVRDEIWTKLVANLSSNPLSVVVEATLEEIYGHPDLRAPALAVMQEVMLVAACHGARISMDPLRLMEVGRSKGAVKTSTLQDYQKGRPLELSAMGEAVLELAVRFDIAMPVTRMMLSLTRFRGSNRT
jgi:2-dehydropantoate 2-reductase